MTRRMPHLQNGAKASAATTSTLLVLVLITSASLGCGPAGAAPGRAQAAPTPAPISVRAAAVESRTLPRLLAVTGALTADEIADVSAERDGRVADVLVERGSTVEKDAVLARLHDVEARAALAQAKAGAEWARSEVKRFAELRQKQVVSPSERQRKEVELEMAEAALVLAEKGLADCVIRAPFEGVVTEKKVSPGAFVRRGQAVAGLMKVAPLRAELSIPESAITAVKVGQGVTLEVQAFPGRTFEGRIAYVGPSIRSEARTLVVEAVVPNPKRELKPGFFVSASIQLPATEPTLLAPVAAIVSESGLSRAYVLGDGRVSERLVSLGERHGDLVAVRTGLAAGERVVLSPDRRLQDGLEVVR